HELCAGPGYMPCNASLRRAMKETDLVILLGHHFEFDLDFGGGINSGTEIVQIAMDQELLHRNRKATLAINAKPSAVVNLLADANTPPIDMAWTKTVIEGWHAEYEAQKGEDDASGLHPVTAVDAVRGALPDD